MAQNRAQQAGRYSVRSGHLGRVLLALTEAGVCALTFGDDEVTLLHHLHHDFPDHSWQRDEEGLAARQEELEAYLQGGAFPAWELDLAGTPFQRQVWEELRKIERGQTRTYAEIARALGNPRAVRAVGRACATNPVSLLVPCHRVIREDGHLGGYRWGLERKEQLLAWEHEGERASLAQKNRGRSALSA